MIAATDVQAALNPLLDDYGYATTKAATAQSLLAAAQEAGVAVTPELEAQIQDLAEGYASATVAAARLDEAQAGVRERAEEMAALRMDVLGGFVKDLVAGKDAADALAGALGKIGDRLLDMALDGLLGGGAGGGLFGGLLGGLLGRIPGFANGGTAPGGLAWVGERGRELVELPRGARVHPHAASEAMAQRGGGAAAPVVNNTRIVNAIDAPSFVEEALKSSRGERAILNYIRANPAAVRSALGV